MITVKRAHYEGDVPAHVKRFAEWLVGMSIAVATFHIIKYRTRYKVCLGGASAETAWLAPWDGSNEWFVSFWC